MGVTEEFAKYRVARELKVAELKAAMAAELEAWACLLYTSPSPRD